MFRIDDHDPSPQTPTRRRIQLIKPTNLPQAVFHLGPSFYTGRSHTLCQTLGEPFLFFFTEGEAAGDEECPCDGRGLLSGADTDGAVGFTLFDEVHELES